MPKPTKLFELLPDAVERAGVTDHQLTSAKVCDAFEDIIQGHPTLPEADVRAVSLKYHILTVQVEGASLASELQMRTTWLLEQLHRRLGAQGVVKRIRFSIQ